ncbi:MAG: PAS domain S-box protein [Desulfarculus sp.]|nr:PAS domain S-box protein [Desulfarculus sp.]
MTAPAQKYKPVKMTHRLSFKLTASVSLSLIVLVVLLASLAIRTQEQNSINSMLQSGNWFSDTVKRATRHSMLKDQRESVHAIIVAIGQQEGVEAIRVLNKRGRIMFSSRAPEIGELVDMQAEACFACHQSDRPLESLPRTKRSRIFTTKGSQGQPGHRVVGVINPIYTEPACYTDPCHVHPQDQTVLGVLDVSLSLAAVDREVAQSARMVVAFAVFLFIVIGGLVSSLTFFFVNRPLSELLEASRQIAQGDYEHAVSPQTDDEIGVLAESFEIMRTGIKEKAEALDQSRAQFQTLFEQVPCHITVQDRDFRLVAFNKMFERQFGSRMGEYCFVAYKGRDAKCPTCSVEATFRDGQMHSAEETVVGQDGQAMHILNLTAPITDKQGHITAVMEMATDITPIRRLETELRKSEEKYRLFFNNDPNPILVFDRESLEILDANDRAAAEYRWPKEELTGRSFLTLTNGADQARVRQFLEQGEAFLPRVHQVRSDGQPFFVNIRASYGEHLGRRAVIATTADISSVMETEQQLIQAAKMATLGEMSAGVAHELNQPLSIISTAGNYLAKQAQRSEVPDLLILRQISQELLSQVERATRIINHLREFGRKARVERGKVNLNQPIEGVFHLLGQQLALHDIEVILELDPELPPIWGESNRLEQIFINLVLNARDAIEELRGQGNASAGQIRVRSWAEDGRVMVSVSDNGVGIPPEQRGRIFEPFFTTKDVGKGTGLGLSISYGIVRDYGGVIELVSGPGQGTTFLLAFPVAREEAA